MGGASNQFMDVSKMNAKPDFVLNKAIKKVSEQLVRHPDGLYISQITGLTNLTTNITKRALAALGCKENAQQQWELPDEAPEVFTAADIDQCSYLAALSNEYVPDDAVNDFFVMQADMVTK